MREDKIKKRNGMNEDKMNEKRISWWNERSKSCEIR